MVLEAHDLGSWDRRLFPERLDDFRPVVVPFRGEFLHHSVQMQSRMSVRAVRRQKNRVIRGQYRFIVYEYIRRELSPPEGQACICAEAIDVPLDFKASYILWSMSVPSWPPLLVRGGCCRFCGGADSALLLEGCPSIVGHLIPTN